MENIIEEIVALIESKKDNYANRVEVSGDDLMVQMFQKQKQSISPEVGAQYIEKFAKILEEKGIIVRYDVLSRYPWMSLKLKNMVILFWFDKDLWKDFYNSFFLKKSVWISPSNKNEEEEEKWNNIKCTNFTKNRKIA